MTNIVEREDIINKLKDKVCKVVFLKANGEERVMNATLKEDVVQPLMEGVNHSGRAYNPMQIRCVDTDKNEWRSFNLEKLISIE